MLEVEIRGDLTKEGYAKLKEFLAKNGKHIESHDREMIMLTEISGYSANPVERQVDIRLKNTSGKCEIVIKHKASDDNSTRKEITIPLPGFSLEPAKELAKAFGCTKGVWMHRKKEIYKYQDIEWSLVEALPKGILYYEAELNVEEQKDVEPARERLTKAAHGRGLKVFSSQELLDFIAMLGREVNKEIML